MKKIKMDRTVSLVAKLVIGLHEKGYDNDFELYGDSELWGAQEGRSYILDEITINQICEIGSQDGKATKYILAIETCDGCKGLLISIPGESIFFDSKKCDQ